MVRVVSEAVPILYASVFTLFDEQTELQSLRVAHGLYDYVCTKHWSMTARP